MRLLLTGASGFLGQHVLHSFLQDPQSKITHIVALVNTAPNLKESIDEMIDKIGRAQSCTVQVESVDLANDSRVEAFLQQQPHFDVCIHTAALSSPRVCELNSEKTMTLNNPTHLFDALIRDKTVIIALSTDQVYEGDPEVAPYSETDATNPVNVYGRSKVAMENHLLGNHAQRSIILRSSLILGPKAPLRADLAHDTFLHFIASREGAETTFYTDECRNAVYVGDVVKCLRWFVNRVDAALGDSAESSLEAFPAGVYNMGGPVSCSRMDMARVVFDWLGYDRGHLIPAKRADALLRPNKEANSSEVFVASPLDISVNSDTLARLTGIAMMSMSKVVEATFPGRKLI